MRRLLRNMSLTLVIGISFISVIMISVATTGFVSYYNGSKAVDSMTGKLEDAAGLRVQQILSSYFDIPKKINQTNLNYIHLNNDESDFKQLNSIFISQLNQYADVVSISYADELMNYFGPYKLPAKDGEYSLYEAIANQLSGNILTIHPIGSEGSISKSYTAGDNYDPRTRIWYSTAINSGKGAWTPVFVRLTGGTVGIDAVLPVTNKNGKVIGVLDTSISLSSIGNFLGKINVSPNGQIFIMDRSGYLIASTCMEEPYQQNGTEIARMLATNCRETILSSAAEYLDKKYGDYNSISKNSRFSYSLSGSKYLGNIIPFSDGSGLDWLIVTIIPEKDVIGQIDENNRATLIIFSCAVLFSILIGLIISRWITKPIIQLSASSKELAKGNWVRIGQTERNDEIGQLSKSFTEMSEQLQSAFKAIQMSEQSLYKQKESLRVTLHSIGDGVIATDTQGKVTGMNKVAEQLTGWSEAEAIGNDFPDVFQISSEVTGKTSPNPIEKVLRTGKIIELANHTVLKDKNGFIRPIADSAAPIMDLDNNITGVVLVFRDTTEARKWEKDITYLSYHDALTGLYNRAFFEEEIHRLDQRRQLPISIIMGDVNGLKLTNDVFGHAQGDKLLMVVAGILSECCRSEDIVARVGGDEFCILLPNTNSTTAQGICNRIQIACFSKDKSKELRTGIISISLGCATKENGSIDIQSILKTAEDVMYKNKLLESKGVQAEIVNSIRASMFEMSHDTSEHAQRLVDMSRQLGKALNLPEEQLNDLQLIALLHDIGKVAIDEQILANQGSMGDAEYEEFMRHSEIGSRIVKASPEISHISDYILTHHERWDGRGYPQGLGGEEIPLLSRVFAVVDSYDDMTHKEENGNTFSSDEACSRIIAGIGKQFDPKIADTFVRVLRSLPM